MPEPTEISLQGAWRIVVESRSAAWNQRVVAENTESGRQVVTGNPGNRLDVYGQDGTPWTLRIQHDDGSGWEDSWLRPGTEEVSGGTITRTVESEDVTTPDSDRDFDDLVIRLEKIGMVEQPARPHAVNPTSLQMMPDGIFEATLGRYYMRVTVRNTWTRPWPSDARVKITRRSKQWLAASGVRVVDAWSSEEMEALGQEVVGGEVVVGDLDPWESRTLYFKVDVAEAAPRKHQVELQVDEETSHLSKYARAPMMVTRTTFDADDGVFRSECDRGTLVAAVRELSVDYNTLKTAVFRARQLFGGEGGGGGPRPGGTGGDGGADGCSEAELERLRRELKAFLAGEDVDLCRLWSRLQCCCAGGGFGGDGGMGDGDPWVERPPSGLEVVAIPTRVEYRVEYASSFEGQFGPIPFDDPWWKVVLAVVAVILALGAAASAAADLANKSDDVVIGQVTRSVLNERVDAAVATLNGERDLTDAIFSYLDAASGEANTEPYEDLGEVFDTAGTTLSNTEIANLITAFNTNPGDDDARKGVRVVKSGARTGLTFGRMRAVRDAPRDDDDDGVADRTFVDQVIIEEDPDFPNGVSNSGDSGSLWLHWETGAIVGLNHAGNRDANTATASRIEDVMAEMGIDFA